MGGASSTKGKRKACMLLVGNLEGNRPLGKRRRRWVDGWMLERLDGVTWAGLDWLRIGTGGELL
jgi:hypothetical protein